MYCLESDNTENGSKAQQPRISLPISFSFFICLLIGGGHGTPDTHLCDPDGWETTQNETKPMNRSYHMQHYNNGEGRAKLQTDSPN